jgi:GMP synthase-like glutamine amidotransferase
MSALTRVGLLRMDDLPESGLPVRGNYPALYAHLFRDQPATLLDVPLHLGESPASLDDADVWVLTGSRRSVYEDVDWIVTACEITRTLIAEERPTVGICFGHQLMGQALGGVVEKAADWGLGTQRYDVSQGLSWLPGADHIDLIASHQDQVVVAPADATVWLRADYCPIAGLIVGKRAWSVQGHPEFTGDVAAALYAGRRSLLGDGRVDAATASLEAELSNDQIAAAIVATAS